MFWTFVLGLLALAAAPSAVLLKAFQGYYRFLTGFEPNTLRSTRMDFTPRHDAITGEGQRLHFVEFSHKAPKARTVEVIGDFNGWKAGTLPLQRQSSGAWELLLPLPPGRYQYHYLVDGVIALDENDPKSLTGKPASLRSVP